MKFGKAQPAMMAEGSPAEEAGETPQFEQHEIEHMADTLTKAEEIKSDPHKMKHVQKHLAKKAAAIGKIRSIDDLRAVAAKKQSV